MSYAKLFLFNHSTCTTSYLSSGHKKVLDNSPMLSILFFVKRIPGTNKGKYRDIDSKISRRSSGNRLIILIPDSIVPGTGQTFTATLLYTRHYAILSYIKDDMRTTSIRESSSPLIIHPSLSLLLTTNIPFLNLPLIISFVGTNTHLLSSSRSEISTSILPSTHLIFPSFTSFCYSLPSNNWYSANYTMNICVYVFTPPIFNFKYSTHPCNSFFPLFTVCIVILLFLFTSNPSLSHRSSQTITISDPSSNNPNSYCLPITTTSISCSSIANSSGVLGMVAKVAPTTGILFCICVWSTISHCRSSLSANRSQIQILGTSTSSICHKLHSVISPSNLRRFPRSQNQLKALKKTFRSMPVTSRGDQYWPRY